MIRLFLLTGFLGSGKTTLLNNLLAEFSNKKIGLIVNEFGKISVDAPVLEKDGIGMVEINNGSIFCSCLESSFSRALIEMSRHPIEMLFVESSGLSDPTGMEMILEDIGRKAERPYDYRGNICVIDAFNFLKVVDTANPTRRQVTCADLILLNKTDIVGEEQIAKVEGRIRELNPFADIIRTTYCRIGRDILEGGFRNTDLTGHLKAGRSSNHPSSRPKTLLLSTQGILSREGLKSFLEALSGATYRIKGFVRLEDGWYHVDCVGDDIVIRPSAKRGDISRLVVIFKVKEFTLAEVRKEWSLRFHEELTVA